jgi:hypothetical protein
MYSVRWIPSAIRNDVSRRSRFRLPVSQSIYLKIDPGPIDIIKQLRRQLNPDLRLSPQPWILDVFHSLPLIDQSSGQLLSSHRYRKALAGISAQQSCFDLTVQCPFVKRGGPNQPFVVDRRVSCLVTSPILVDLRRRLCLELEDIQDPEYKHHYIPQGSRKNNANAG